MKKYLVLLMCITFGFCFSSVAHATLFTFDELSAFSGSPVIESYMEGIYGSDIVVIGAGTRQENVALGPDTFLINLRDVGFMDILIGFVDVPIRSVSFDWQVFADSGPTDFAFAAYDADHNIIGLPLVLNSGIGFGTIGPILFSEPAYVLSFSNNRIHDIGIDNLNVTPVPEPASILLFSSGLLGLSRLRRGRFLGGHRKQ